MGHGGLGGPAPRAGHPRLLADIGGTHARLAWVPAAGAPLEHVLRVACAEHASLEALLASYRSAHGLPVPAAAALGVAAHVSRGTTVLTNRDWRVDAASIGAALGGVTPLLCNDFAALARGLATLRPGDVQPVGEPGRAVPGAPCVAIGAGTGLGVAGLVPRGGAPVVVSGEGGHASLAAETPAEHAIVQRLAQRFGRVSAERVLSGSGLVNLYEVVCDLAGREPTCPTPQAVLSGTDEDCAASVEQFAAWLGAFAGDVALTFDARGGVYLAGGVVAALGERLERSTFRRRFEAKDHMAPLLHTVPVRRIVDAPLCALHGADALLDDLS